MKKKITLSIIAALVCAATFIAFKADRPAAADQYVEFKKGSAAGNVYFVNREIKSYAKSGYKLNALSTYKTSDDSIMFVMVFQK